MNNHRIVPPRYYSQRSYSYTPLLTVTSKDLQSDWFCTCAPSELKAHTNANRMNLREKLDNEISWLLCVARELIIGILRQCSSRARAFGDFRIWRTKVPRTKVPFYSAEFIKPKSAEFSRIQPNSAEFSRIQPNVQPDSARNRCYGGTVCLRNKIWVPNHKYSQVAQAFRQNDGCPAENEIKPISAANQDATWFQWLAKRAISASRFCYLGLAGRVNRD